MGFATTLDFTADAGLTLDFGKTWFWVSDPGLVEAVRSAIQESVPGFQVSQKSTATDLGFQLQYSGGFRLGVNQERVDKALLRLKRLQTMNLDLDTKATLIRMSVFPAALYGSAIRPPSQETLDRLRSYTAQAFLGYSQSMSAAIALLLAPGGCLDPELWMTCAIFRTVRCFLLRASCVDKSSFLTLAAKFTGCLMHVRGPASAFGYLVKQLGWSLDAHGVIDINGFLRFDLCESSFQRFRRFLHANWQRRLIMAKTHRKSWFHFPDVAVLPTMRALKHFSQSQQRTLIRENSGAFQSCQQKAKWNEAVDGTCPFCPAQDTREHRLLECPIGADLRSNFQDVISWLDSSGAEFAEFPYVTVHPSTDALLCSAFALPVPTLDDAVLDFVHSRFSRGYQVHWFTDGSCCQSCDPSFSYAAYAIAVDLCYDDDVRVQHATNAECTGLVPPTFQKVLAARTHGEQDILRSEIYAAVVILLGARQGVIHIDSLAALKLLNLALHSPTLDPLISREHFDLLVQVWRRRADISCELVKVKAHTDISLIRCPLQQYWTWGNVYVDSVAVAARDNLLPPLVKECAQLAFEVEEQVAMLRRVFELQLDLRILRAKAISNMETATASTQMTASAIDLAYQQWSVEDPISLIGDFDDQFWHFSMFGPGLMKDMLAWMRLLQWPAEIHSQGPMGFQTGVSWVELALSFMIVTGSYLPVLREDAHGKRQLVHPQTFHDAKEIGLCSTECGTILQKLWDNIRSVTPEPMNIPGSRRKVASLYHLGAARYVQGWHIRYVFPRQKEVNEILRLAISEKQCIIEFTPDLTSFLDPNRPRLTFSTDYDDLLQKCTRGQYHVRKHRKLHGL